jgi:hypothetical protein
MTASHYLIVTADDELRADTSSDMQDDAMACEHRGVAYTAFVVFTDGTRREVAA